MVWLIVGLVVVVGLIVWVDRTEPPTREKTLQEILDEEEAVKTRRYSAKPRQESSFTHGPIPSGGLSGGTRGVTPESSSPGAEPARNAPMASPSLEEKLAAEHRVLSGFADRASGHALPGAGYDPTLDEARLAMQKIAYTMVGPGVSPLEKDRFKQAMTEFASVDPVVHHIAARARQIIAANPGQLQSKIYVYFPGCDKEQVRYALYFADELGWIHRKKKGNSYQLFLAGGNPSRLP